MKCLEACVDVLIFPFSMSETNAFVHLGRFVPITASQTQDYDPLSHGKGSIVSTLEID